MKELGGLVDALYSRFMLRDVFGKVVPGAIAILAYALGGGEPRDILKFLSDVPLVAWLFLYGLAWLAGFAVQQIPELLRRSHIHDREMYDREGLVFLKHMRSVRHTMSEDHDHQQLERFIVIKEATGNACWAVGIVPILLLLGAHPSYDIILQRWWPFIKLHWPILAVWLTVTYLLHRMHKSALNNQKEYMEMVVPRTTLSNGEQNSSQEKQIEGQPTRESESTT